MSYNSQSPCGNFHFLCTHSLPFTAGSMQSEFPFIRCRERRRNRCRVASMSSWPVLLAKMLHLVNHHLVLSRQSKSVWITSVSKQFQDCPDGFKSVRMVLILSGRFKFCPNNLKLSGWFYFYLDGCKTVRTVLKLSGQFQNCLNDFNSVQTISKLSGWF